VCVGRVPSTARGTEVRTIDFLRRLLGKNEDRAPDTHAGTELPEPLAAPAQVLPPASPASIACPSCGYLIDPPPTRGRRCPACRQPIVVRQVDGRPAYLTKAAIEVFAAERRRDAEGKVLDTERKQWLRLAATVEVPFARRSKLAGAPPSAEVVAAARRLYTTAADRAVVAARREKRWVDAAQIRRAQAAAIYAAGGSPVPPPDDVIALHQEGMAALLRSFAAQGSDAELVSAGCCPACRSDDGKVCRISQELRAPRLPHAGCPRGICGCDWWIGVVERKRRRRNPPTRAGAG
jgi:hypothetical protein